jgi:hypothetical protein
MDHKEMKLKKAGHLLRQHPLHHQASPHYNYFLLYMIGDIAMKDQWTDYNFVK